MGGSQSTQVLMGSHHLVANKVANVCYVVVAAGAVAVALEVAVSAAVALPVTAAVVVVAAVQQEKY